MGKAREADLYALREYLDKCAETDRLDFFPSGTFNLRDFIGGERYIFTHVNVGAMGAPSFQLKGGRLFGKYPLVTFRFREEEEKIRVHPGRISGNEDRKRIGTLVGLLEDKPYAQLISNLDDLKKEI